MELHYGDLSRSDSDLYVFCDMCESNYIIDNYLPILRIINQSGDILNPYFTKIVHQQVSQLRIFIRCRDGEYPSFTPRHLRCTLRVRRKP